MKLYQALCRSLYWHDPRWGWFGRLFHAVRRDLSYTAEYRMGPDAWEQNGNHWRERRRFIAWLDAG